MQFTPAANFALETDDAFVLSQVGCAQTLVRYDDTAGTLEPSLATEWKQTQPTAWDFTLRDGVKFQNGAALTAQSVADALTKALAVESPAKAFKPSVVSSVKAVDDKTVRITSPKPSPLVPYRVASVNTAILAPEAYSASGINPVGTCTGPFTVTEYTPKQSLKLKRNDAYWGTKAAIPSVEAVFAPEGATRATQVRTGEADIALAVPSTSLTDLGSNKDVVVSKATSPRTTGLYLNTKKAPFDKPQVRQAVQLALDTQTIAKQVYDGAAEPATGPFSPDEPWSPKSKAVTQDLAKAKSLLTAAGVRPGQLSLELLGYTERAEQADLAAVVQASLAKIGITVKIRIADYAAIEPALLEGKYDMALLSRNHLVDIADPIGFLSADYTCEGSYNISQYCDPEMDKLIASADSIDDAAARHKVYAQAAQRLHDEAVTVFLVHEQLLSAARSNVKSFHDDPLVRYAVTPELSLG